MNMVLGFVANWCI